MEAGHLSPRFMGETAGFLPTIILSSALSKQLAFSVARLCFCPCALGLVCLLCQVTTLERKIQTKAQESHYLSITTVYLSGLYMLLSFSKTKEQTFKENASHV